MSSSLRNPSTDFSFLLQDAAPGLHAAAHWQSLGDGRAVCLLCAHGCELDEGEVGICGVRVNADGRLLTHAYGHVIACQPSAVEKLRIYHYRPGSTLLCVATPGCNFHCAYCTNHDMAFVSRDRGESIDWGKSLSPEEVVTVAQVGGWRTIAFAYTEPTVFYEYALNIARTAQQAGIDCVMNTNGYIRETPLLELLPHIAAASVDLKSFRDVTYRRNSNAKLQPVIDTLRSIKAAGIWLEVTTTVIPSLNDSEQELRDLTRFLVELDDGIPWHINRFYPSFEMENIPVTPNRTLVRAWEIGLEEGLHHVYTDALLGRGGEQTLCRECRHVLVDRSANRALSLNLNDGRCPGCDTPVDYIKVR
ncbi:MAG: AmmeMemoRadiSam system radical SAM enzyme [Armatimonadetes bacterium]|nr:AmmeMemoRadiSam system radical SAM enzyme [Armatimonadota bacterium]PIU62776.1 MAG: AmmeMemoRadiSam system radical SAM enzyme [Armatimonadetes bacterium CG07_land_8_20_14_0_80_59_28]PIX39920.1 MAG: AmmeMemoRadiSam system radical SAM enzyme [Armatimonadetes bacterium CG_4_8_14_3_um_filter_58_9]PIY37807.1 MAG: AmmeMemoRadiSam system radical SAM enzyme [Armatimonadetes bacterium CG_4_10_14_3_um_filter_59_10]